MKHILIFSLLFIFSACAKVGYLLEQGKGQIALEWNAISNEDVLKDDKYSDEIKEKIKIILKAKKHFYKYFDKDETSIYTKTTFLKSQAVTYLVIVSPKDQIKAVRTSFPFYGSFPYLGFFSKESAKEYAKEKREEGYATYVRPVYAYSTLDQWIFSDNILSSFFHFKEEELVDLVFHELVHTIIFVKNEVEFNENLAQHIAQNMTEEYFNFSEEKKKQIEERKKKYQNLNHLIVKSIKELNEQYKTSKNGNETLEHFLHKSFFPNVKSFCQKAKMERCWPLKVKWNNARFAAIGTYENKRESLIKLQKKLKLDIKDFFLYVEKKYKEYNSSDNQTFLQWLEKGQS